MMKISMLDFQLLRNLSSQLFERFLQLVAINQEILHSSFKTLTREKLPGKVTLLRMNYLESSLSASNITVYKAKWVADKGTPG